MGGRGKEMDRRRKVLVGVVKVVDNGSFKFLDCCVVLVVCSLIVFRELWIVVNFYLLVVGVILLVVYVVVVLSLVCIVIGSIIEIIGSSSGWVFFVYIIKSECNCIK